MSAQPTKMPAGNDLAMMAHLLGIPFPILGALIIYLIAGHERPFVRSQAAEALNFQINVGIFYGVLFVAGVAAAGPAAPLAALIGVVGLIALVVGIPIYVGMCIYGGLRAYKGANYQYSSNIIRFVH